MAMALSGDVSFPSLFPIFLHKILTKPQAEIYWETQSLLGWISKWSGTPLVLGEGRWVGVATHATFRGSHAATDLTPTLQGTSVQPGVSGASRRAPGR